MVKTKLILPAAIALLSLFASDAPAAARQQSPEQHSAGQHPAERKSPEQRKPAGKDFRFEWSVRPSDGHMTGVTIPGADNVRETLGYIDSKGVYHSPGGRTFKGSVASVASLLIAAQESMDSVKTEIGYCPVALSRTQERGPLPTMIADKLAVKAAELTGLKIDISLANYGGVRSDMPQGSVTLDDIISMLPFNNHIVVVRLKGTDVERLFSDMMSTELQIYSGVSLEIEGSELKSVKVGGVPLDPEAVYNLATVDFLLAGGDNVYAARNAIEIIDTGCLLRESLLDYLKILKDEGKPIEYHCGEL